MDEGHVTSICVNCIYIGKKKKNTKKSGNIAVNDVKPSQQYGCC